MNGVACGDATGLVKVVDGGSGTLKATFGVQSPGLGINRLFVLDDAEIVAALKNGHVVSRAIESGDILGDYHFAGARDLTGVAGLPNRRIVACDASGCAAVFDLQSPDVAVAEFRLGNNTQALASCGVHIACGGREQDLSVLDAETQASVFRARNVPNTKLSLRVPVWIKAVTFVGGNADIIATGTAHHQVRLYDTRRGRRPVGDREIGENAVTVVASSTDGNFVFAGDGAGILLQLDRRKDLQQCGRFVGNSGGIRAIDVCDEFIASVGLDRTLHVHDIKTRKEVKRVYLKQRLEGVAFVKGAASSEAAQEKEEEDDVDEMWRQMESADDDDDDSSGEENIEDAARPPSKKHKADKQSEAV
ncbi:Ribosome biogenesis protein NSA1 [Plasmodiophora brassicae]|uniref:Ribosome biogenesis protein NSA1 n=2 Tax=Plasmodiophora brassicae TaxID=37360 RepID=A0A3P3Y8X8_PLABS|nr:unnamed protein product [Plasmodiophora brassicae]